MTRQFAGLASLVAFASLALPAHAEQYLVQISEPLTGISDALYKSVKVVPLGAFEKNGVHYVVLDAPNTTYVETLFSVYGTWPKQLHTLTVDWDGDAMQAMSLERRMQNMTATACRFCLG